MPENEIAVSVIVYAHNAQRTLPRCLHALQGQSLRARARMEVVVVDGGSDDRTYEIALECKRADPELLRLHRRADAAPGTGLALARGKYAAFCEANYIAPPDMYETLYSTCEKDALDFAGLAGAHIWDRTLRGMLARKAFLLAHGLPVEPGYAQAGQLAAYDTLRALVRSAELPLFCSRWMETLRGICLEEYKSSGGGAAFYAKMISLAAQPQTEEAVAFVQRCALDRRSQNFYDAFKARDWPAVGRRLRCSKAGAFAERKAWANPNPGLHKSKPGFWLRFE